MFLTVEREMHGSFDEKEFVDNIKTSERLVQISVKAESRWQYRLSLHLNLSKLSTQFDRLEKP